MSRHQPYPGCLNIHHDETDCIIAGLPRAEWCASCCEQHDEEHKPLEKRPVKDLRKLAVGMPYRSEASKEQLVNWLATYHETRPGR